MAGRGKLVGGQKSRRNAGWGYIRTTEAGRRKKLYKPGAESLPPTKTGAEGRGKTSPGCAPSQNSKGLTKYVPRELSGKQVEQEGDPKIIIKETHISAELGTVPRRKDKIPTPRGGVYAWDRKTQNSMGNLFDHWSGLKIAPERMAESTGRKEEWHISLYELVQSYTHMVKKRREMKSREGGGSSDWL